MSQPDHLKCFKDEIYESYFNFIDSYDDKTEQQGKMMINDLNNKLMKLKEFENDINIIIKNINSKINKTNFDNSLFYKTDETGFLNMMNNTPRVLSIKPSKSNKDRTKKTYINEINYNIQLNKCDSLGSIAPMFNKFIGDEINPEGIYISIIKDIFIKVPIVDIVAIKESERKFFTQCKYITEETCNIQRSRMANYHKSAVRYCNYLHTGDKNKRYVDSYRCSIPNFGNPSSFLDDLESVHINDIRRIMMNGLNDLFICSLYLDYNKSNIKNNKILVYNLDTL